MTRPLAIVFGGSRGIGAACVDALRKQGFDVARTSSGASTAEASLDTGRSSESSDGQEAVTRTYHVDVRDGGAVERLFATVQAEFGRAPACVVANAGINVPPGPLASFADEDFRQLVEVNIVGAFHMLRGAARAVADGGSVIALTTSLVRHAAPGLGPYSASKAAVESLVRSLARELAPRGVRVNGVAPGPVDTDLFRAGKNDEAKARSAAMSPFNRVGLADEVAEVVAFLASARASWVSGQIVQPNGGLV
jgi:3-oxoacyl-[acyl-carrier protein] reductase